MNNHDHGPLTIDDLKPFWRGTADVNGAEELWGGLGAHKSFKLEGQTLTIEFVWLRRIPRGQKTIPREEIKNRDERIKRFNVGGVTSATIREMRLHCGDTTVTLKHR